MGGTMRLGSYPCRLKPGSIIYSAYKEKVIFERHRHRYEFNSIFKERMEEKGMTVCGLSPDGLLAEAVEIKNHPWFVAVQYHPEFKSKPVSPHPLFKGFVKAAVAKNKFKKAKEIKG